MKQTTTNKLSQIFFRTLTNFLRRGYRQLILKSQLLTVSVCIVQHWFYIPDSQYNKLLLKIFFVCNFLHVSWSVFFTARGYSLVWLLACFQFRLGPQISDKGRGGYICHTGWVNIELGGGGGTSHILIRSSLLSSWIVHNLEDAQEESHGCFFVNIKFHFTANVIFAYLKSVLSHQNVCGTKWTRLLVSGRSPECSDCLLKSMEQ